MDEFLLRVLATALGRNARLAAFDDLEQRLLNAFTRNIARDRKVLGLAGDLVDLVDVDDADLGAIDVEVGRRDELEQDVLDVFPDVARFGECRGVGDGEGDLQRARKRLGEEGLARTGRAEKHDVALRQLNVVGRGGLAEAHSLVVVVDGNGQSALGLFLTDHVLGELLEQLAWGGQIAQGDARGGRVLNIGGDVEDLVEGIGMKAAHVEIGHHRLGRERNALVADVDAIGALDHGINLIGGLAAERAADTRGRGHDLIGHAVPRLSRRKRNGT